MSEVAIKVAVRVRPFNRREMENNQKNIIRVLDTSTLVFDPDEDEDEFFFHGAKQTHRDITKRIKKKLSMEFDSVFNDETTNDQVFEVCTKPIVTSVMNGFNCSVFVYGATGAGKTFTMLGSENNPGITFLTMRELFAQMDQLGEDRKFDIGISYLEVYNEKVMNLLTKSGPLRLREDSNGVVVTGLVLKQIHNAEELFDLLILGNKNRTQHPTDANSESSRSHAVFQVHIRMTNKKTSVRRTVKLSMIDLAGSERAQSTKCKGLRFKEGANINKSLLALGNCINKLADGCKHIPYRDSNLTRILKDSLGGNCQTLMIANISPSSLTYEDTYNTLKYATRAKKIRTTLRQNVLTSNVPKEFLVKKCNEQISEIEKLKAENETFKERIKMLETQVMDQQCFSQKSHGGGDTSIKRNGNLEEWHEKIEAVFDNFKKIQEKCLSLQSNEKILNFRIKFKERCEEIKKVLTLDGSCIDTDLSRLEASIDKYSKEISRIKNEDQTIWTKRFKDANRAIENLKREIEEQNLSSTLEMYLHNKTSEIENSKLLMKAAHVYKVNNNYQTELERWNEISLKSCEILQENFLLLRSIGELDSGMMEKLQTLRKMLQGQRIVKFAEGEASAAPLVSSNPEPTGSLSLKHIINLSSDDDHLHSPMLMKKRANDNEEQEESASKKSKNSESITSFQFLRPKALKSINFDNASASGHAMDANRDLNITFDLQDTRASDVLPIKIPSNDKLSDRSNIAGSSSRTTSSTSTLSSRSVITKGFKPSKPAVSSKYAFNINKENKKFSPRNNRVKKLPRTPSRTVGSKGKSQSWSSSVAAQVKRTKPYSDHRPKLIKSAVSSSLVVMPGKAKIRTPQKKI